MKKDLLNLSVKAFIVGISFAIGAIATTAIAVTVSTTFTSGDTLTAASMNVIKSAIESIPGWAKGTNTNDAVYTAGNVGIGTTSPVATLQIESNNANGQLRIDSTTSDLAVVDVRNTDGRILLCKQGASGGCISGGTAYAGVVATGSADPLQFATNDTPRMTIDSTGKVGIGTTSPEFNFEIKSSSGSANMALDRVSNIYGANIRLQTNSTNDWLIGQNGTSNSDLNFYSYGTGNEVMTILRSNGNVGIGTTSPGAKLDVAGDAQFGITGITGTVLKVLQDGANGIQIRADRSDGSGARYLSFGTDYNERVRIDSTGNVGIGTPSPAEALSLVGAMNITPQASPPTTANAGDLYVDTAGNELCFYDGSNWQGISSGNDVNCS